MAKPQNDHQKRIITAAQKIVREIQSKHRLVPFEIDACPVDYDSGEVNFELAFPFIIEKVEKDEDYSRAFEAVVELAVFSGLKILFCKESDFPKKKRPTEMCCQISERDEGIYLEMPTSKNNKIKVDGIRPESGFTLDATMRNMST